MIILPVSSTMKSTFVSALDVSLEDPNNARRGKDVNFGLEIELTQEETYLYESDNFMIKYIELTFEGPKDFEEVCRIENNELKNCDLDLSFSKSYDSGLITYEFEWDTPSSLKTGDYTVKAKIYATKPLETYGYNSCSVLQGRYQAWYSFEEGYDASLDLNEDGVINLVDISEFQASSMHRHDGEMFGRFQGFFKLVGEYQSIAGIDFYRDGVIDLSDIGLLAQYLDEQNPEVDLNGDGVVNLSDIALIAQALEASRTSSEYEQSLDLNGDGIVNLSDVAILASKIYEGYEGVIDYNGDGVINLIDASIAAQNMYNTEWCTERLEIMDGLSTVVITSEAEFDIKSSSSGRSTSGSNSNEETQQDETINDLGSNEESTQSEFTPVEEAEYSLHDMWVVVAYLVGIILALGGIAILSKRL